MGVALVAGWLGLAGSAKAQYMPSPVGAARMPEPLPCGPSGPPPNLVPGPISPLAAPPGPPDPFSLPAEAGGAFQCENFLPDNHAYFSAGAFSLQRQRMGHNPIALFDIGSQGIDTGLPPPRGSPKIEDLNDVVPKLSWGAGGTLGYLWGNHAIEVTGWYIFGNDAHDDATAPGSLDSFFFHPPLGFEGDNGLWLQADRIRVFNRSNMWDAEVNYRHTNLAETEAELILGVRYLDLQDRFGIFTDDDGLTFVDVFGNPDPKRQATYSVRAHNRILAPQIGFEYEKRPLYWLSLGCKAKGAWGVNFIDNYFDLQRGDGFRGFSAHRSATIFSSVYEVGAFADVHILERFRVRAGYTAMWLVHVDAASDQLNFNLAAPLANKNNDGSIFYYGPSIEFQFLF
jgi:hypothetical protein